MTEVEAETKRCPFGVGAFDPKGKLTYSTCVGSSCMAWRWIVAPGMEKIAAHMGIKGSGPQGRCGLAGE